METQRDIQILIPVTVFLLFYCEAVSTSSGFYSAEVGADVTLRCLSSKLPPLQDIRTLTLEWNRVDAHGHRHAVYVFAEGQTKVKSEGAEVNRTGLMFQDASLRLRNISVGNEGLYTCRVYNPVVDTITATLEVIAHPAVSLPEKAAIAVGEEKVIVCDIQRYYPEKLSVTWLFGNATHTLQAQASHLYRVCTEMAVHNADGTYSIRSGITVHSSALKHSQIKLICQVEHQTRPFSPSVTLTEAISQPYDPVTLMAGSSVASVLLVLAAVGAVFLLLRHSRRKAMYHFPPIISEISQPSVTYADAVTALKCTISGVELGEFQVRWSKLSEDTVDSEVVSLLQWDDLSERGSLESNGSHHISVLSLCLSTSEDKSRFKCEVHWNGRTMTRETMVHVKVEPSFLQISSIPQIPKIQRLLVLCCRVENFYPSEIYLEWFRNDGESVPPATHYGPFSDHSHLYSMWSKVQLTMATEDERAVYTCRVYHSSFSVPGYKDVHYHINTHGTPPNVMFIDCDPLHPAMNTECTLHLCIKDFCPKHVAVTWTVDGEPVDDSCVFNTPPSLNFNGLYSMYSFLKVSPTTQWKCCYSCRVEHSAQGQPEDRNFTLTYAPHTPPLR